MHPARRICGISRVSIPFSSGKRRRRDSLAVHLSFGVDRFNPLLVGEAAPPGTASHCGKSRGIGFQSPSRRGSGAASRQSLLRLWTSRCFNPLLVGEAAPPIAVAEEITKEQIGRVSIPFSSGKRRRLLFTGNIVQELAASVSIPFSSGKRRRRIINAVPEDPNPFVFQSPSRRGSRAARHSIALRQK